MLRFPFEESFTGRRAATADSVVTNDNLVPDFSMRPRASPRRHLTRLFAVFSCCWLLFFTIWIPAASAHAVLVSSDPTNNAVLEQPPPTITLTFDEPVQVVAHSIRLIDPNGDELTPVSIASRDAAVSASLDPITVPGTYTVGWEVVSADGHDVKSGFVFHFRTRTANAPQHLDSSPDRLALGLRILGTAVSIGAFVWALSRGRRRLVWCIALAGGILAAFGTIASIGGSFSEGYDIVSGDITGTFFAITIAIALAGIVVTRTSLRQPLAAAGIVALALPGHGIALDPVWRSATLTIVHVLAATGWAAGLLWLERRCRDVEDPDVITQEVRRFSPWAMGFVAVVAVSGTVLLVTRTGWHGLWSSGYGVIGLVKIALLGIALGLAVRNRWLLAPHRLRRSIHIEIGMLTAALLAGALLGQVAPPTSDASAVATVQRRAFGTGQVELLIDPGRIGTNQIHLSALTADGVLDSSILDLTVELRMPARSIGPITPQVTTNRLGHLQATAELTIPGTWNVRVTGHHGKFDQLVATFDVPIR